MEVAIGKRLFALALVVALSTSAVIAIAILLFGEFDETSGRILATTAMIGLYSLLSLPGGVLLDQGRHLPLAWAVIGLAVVSFLLTMTITWGDPDAETGWRFAGSLTTWAGAFSQTAAVTSRRRETDTSGIRILYFLSIGTAFLLAILIVTLIWEEFDDTEGYIRFLGAVAVANVVLVLLQPASRRLRRAPASAPAEPVPKDGHRVVFTLSGAPAQEAVEEARAALERGGVRVERVERLP